MNAFNRITVTDAKALIETQRAVVIDIRDEDSFNLGRIRNATHLDNTGVQDFIQQADLDAPVLVCCYHGHSSQPAAAYLAEQGFGQVYSVDGGYTLWQQTYPDECDTG